jgi:hypothetical protein
VEEIVIGTEWQGRHFETGTICNALAARGARAPHTNKPYSEALLFGVSGGIAVGYMTFQYQGWPPHLALLTRNTFDPWHTIVERLGIVEDTKETTDRDRGLANLIEAIESGSAPVIWADVFSLPYTALPKNEKIWQMMPMLVHGYDGASFHLADRSRRSLGVSIADLMAARARVKKDRFRIATLSPPDAKRVPQAVEAGIRHCIALFKGVGVPRGHSGSFGLAGLEKWADALVNEKAKESWAKVFRTGADRLQALAGRVGQPGLFIWIMTSGSAPDGERGLFADFLDEAAKILKQPKLGPVADQFRKSQMLWRDVAEAALPASNSVLGETRELISRQRQLFIENGQEADVERSEIRTRLAENAKAAAEVLDDSSGVLTLPLLRDIREHVLRIHAAERKAFAALETLFP